MKLTEQHIRDFVSIVNKDSDNQSANVMHYLEYLPNYHKNTKLNWNWSAAIFSVIWLFYRCMPFYGILTAALLIAGWWSFNALALCMVFAVGILLGMFGDYIYLSRIDQHVRAGHAPGRGKILSLVFLTVLSFGAPFAIQAKHENFSLGYTYLLYARVLGIEKPLKTKAACGRTLPRIKIIKPNKDKAVNAQGVKKKSTHQTHS